ncbi:MAG: hypothetical protein M3Z19_16485 [Chloroflexota bacterium]|nr:hypothetical protein [Chloroflexota bacterium]
MDDHNLSIGRTVSRRKLIGMVAGVVGTAILAACGGSSTATPIAATSAPAAGSAPTQTPAAASSSPSAASTPAATAQKVNANTASQAELLAAFQANGIPSAAQWVREVMEYRPYPTNDPTFAKLRTELAKYNPSPDVVDKIIASLSL